MTRTLEVKYNTGVALTIEVVVQGANAITDTIVMTEKTVAKQTYTGTINALTPAGDYDLNFKVGVGGVYLGYDEVRIETTDGVTYRGRSTSHVKEIAAAPANKIADHGRRRTQANVQASSDGDAISVNSQYGDIQAKQKGSIASTTLTIKNPDGTTLGTLPVTLDANAVPIKQVGT